MALTPISSSRFLTIAHIITFLVASNMVACKCGPNKNNIQKDEPDLGEHQAVELFLNRISAGQIAGDQKTISLEIENKGSVPTAVNQLKLKIIREEGSSAMVKDSSRVGSTNVYMMDLPFILAAKEKKRYDLTINSDEDNQAKFSIQLQYEGKDIGGAVKVSWEQGVMLGFDEIKYDRASGKVYVDMYNKGTKKATDVKLMYHVQTPAGQLGGLASKEMQVGDIGEDKEKRKYEVGSLDFGPANKSVVVEFSLSCTEKGAQVIASETKTFIKADIKVSIDIAYDKQTGKVDCKLKNEGTELAQGLEFVYNNVSLDVEGKQAKLQLEPGSTLAIGDLAAGQEQECSFKLNLQEAEKATFDFQVIYDQCPVVEKTQTFKAQPIRLSLEIQSIRQDEFKNYVLYGSENEIAFKIIQAEDSRFIDLASLTLDIESLSGGTVSEKAGEAAITELPGSKLGNLADPVKLYVNPTPGAKEAHFKFELRYKNQPVGQPVVITWQELTIFINKQVHCLVSYQEGSFVVSSLSSIPLGELTVTIEGSNQVPFELLKKDATRTRGTIKLADVTDYAASDKLTQDIRFQVGPNDNKRQAQATIIIKRGDIELAKEEIDWVTEGISLSVTTSVINNNLEENLAEDILINNTHVDEIDLTRVRVRVTNTAGSLVNLGQVSGINIDKTLAEITGQNKLGNIEAVKIPLRLGVLPAHKLIAGVVLELFDDQDAVLDKKLFVCVASGFIAEVTAIINATSIVGDINNFSQTLERFVYNPSKLTEVLAALEGFLVNGKKVLAEINHIIQADPTFKTELSQNKKVIDHAIKQLEANIAATKGAIAALKDDKVALALAAKLEQCFSIVQKSIEEHAISLKELHDNMRNFKKEVLKDNVKKMVRLLMNESDGGFLEVQSIKVLYEYYTYQLNQGRDFLMNLGITDFNPSNSGPEGVNRLKGAYKNMVDNLPNIEHKMQGMIVSIFEWPQYFTEKIKEAKDTRDPVRLYNFLSRQLKYLSLIQKGCNLDFKPQIFYQYLVKNYQVLAAEAADLVQMEYAVEGKLDGLADNAELAFNAADYAFKIFQLTNNQEIKQATNNIFLSAIKAYEEIKKLAGENYKIELNGKNKVIQQVIDELAQKLN